MTILCISAVHNRPDLLWSQIRHYNHCMDDDVHHVIHISKTFFKPFEAARISGGLDFTSFGNVHLFSAVETRWAKIFHAVLQGVDQALRMGLNFDYLYIHTAADLPIKRGMGSYIRRYDLGAVQARPISEKSRWAPCVAENLKLRELCSSLRVQVPLKSRMEGAFFRREIFADMVKPLSKVYPTMALDDMPDYPVEEVDLACCIEAYCRDNRLRRTRHMIDTSSNPEQLVSLDDLARLEQNAEVYGVKRFGQDIQDSMRQRVRQMIGLLD